MAAVAHVGTFAAAIMEGAVRGGAVRHVAAAVASSLLRTALATGSDEAFEVQARLDLVKPALQELVAAGIEGREPRVPGGKRAARNYALHGGMGGGAEALPQDGKEAKQLQRAGCGTAGVDLPAEAKYQQPVHVDDSAVACAAAEYLRVEIAAVTAKLSTAEEELQNLQDQLADHRRDSEEKSVGHLKENARLVMKLKELDDQSAGYKLENERLKKEREAKEVSTGRLSLAVDEVLELPWWNRPRTSAADRAAWTALAAAAPATK